MSNKALIELVKCRWREFRREPSAMFFVVLMPVLWMIILGFAFSGNSRELYNVGWVGATDSAVFQNLDDDKIFKMIPTSTNGATDLLKTQKAQIVVYEQNGSFKYSFDEHNQPSKQAWYAVDKAIQEAGGRKNVFITEKDSLQLPGNRYVDFLIPGLLAFSIMTTSLYGTGMTIVANRRENVLKRYMATPMRPLHYIVSHIIGRYFILAVEILVILVTGVLIFDFEIAGSFVQFCAVAALGAAMFTSIAILCAARTESNAVMNGVSNLIVLPMMMISGVWFSRSNFPDWIAEPASYLALSPLLDGLRKISLEGLSIANIGPEISIMIAWLIGTTFLAKIRFRWY